MATGGDRLTAGAGGILSYFTRHRTAANLLLVLMISAGLLAFPNMRAQFFPDVVVDDLSVSVNWDGAGAEDVDAAIVQVLEPVLLGVEGVTSSSSRSTEGRATIRLEFDPGYDIDRAAEDVQLAVDSTNNLPDDADDPNIRRGGWSDRVTDVVLTGPVGVDQLARFADEFSIRLFAEGVTQVVIQGVAAPSTIVQVPSLALIEHDIGMADIAARIAEEADADPAGDVSSSARVRTGVAKRTAEDIGGIVLRSNADGSKLTIADVAQIKVEGTDRERAYFVGDDPAIKIRVQRSAQGDAIGMQRTVEQVRDELTASLPVGVSIALTNGRAEFIEGRLNILLDNGLTGLMLVVALLFLFLNARTAFWVAAGIPVAMLAAIALMYAVGITINMISLFALIITLGIVVDDAIVVGEHADYRVRQLGEHPTVAAENAAKRMFSPVFSATTTTIIAFFGLVVIGGRFGSLIADIPYTVIVVLAASLIECFLILPNHLSHAIAHTAKDHWYDLPSKFVNKGFDWCRDRLFRPFMRFVIWARYPVFALALVALASQLALFIKGDVNWRFFNAPEQSQVTGNFSMLPGATREDTLEMMREMQRATEALGAEYAERHGLSPLKYVVAEVGGNSGRAVAGSETKDADQLGSITIELIDADSRPYSSFSFVSELQDSIVQHPMAETVSFRSWGRGPGGDSLDIQMFGADSETLKAAAEALKAELLQFSEISGLEDSQSYDKEELILELTPQGQALGLNIDGLGRVLRNRLGGIEAASYPDGARSATIRVELPPEELSADFLDRTQIRTGDGFYVPLADVVTSQSRTGFSTVVRENGIQLISVQGDLDDDNADRATEIQKIINDDILPRIESNFGVQSQLSGQSEQERNFLADAQTGLVLVLLGIYLTLSWIFSSWTRPVVVMAIIPFGLVGTIWGHYVWDVPLSMFSVVGMIGMVGIIINDSIVLVTTVDEYAQDRGLVPAIIDGAADRLRPVMLTTMTTVLGLMPLLYERSNQAEFLKPTVITLVFGLGVGMFLVLLVVPSLMAMQADVGKQVQSAKRALGGRRAAIILPAGLGAVGAALLFAATLGPVIVTGAAWAPVAAIMPILNSGIAAAFGVFAAGLALLLLAIYVLASATIGAARLRN
ncbi:efflux RND transporter permease subunit [Yoonia sediminilitoris]|uniref:Multidrug efflux pump subunit AcrB n=1 Tax=Yoonia sediminilitoris TaxID=1286148 RepID=A0A2T6KIB3_9RHOB|nr:efflux RND transporter permease subunit [Yoonia sediminilitoris]PUB15447.1 multidrug efflux pump subunit AcrB [Yoonia sediminilitoris]RCW96057.1 multidrug efflux pump subunit AcrB [Yoonia sediminilitoris]